MPNKRIILRPEDKEDEPPSGLKIAGHFKRKGILNPAIIQKQNKIDLFSRLIYEDDKGLNSCIILNKAVIDENSVKVLDYEKLVFAPNLPHGNRGVEDLRISKLKGEYPFHGFLVHFNGTDARTEYLRTKETTQKDIFNWNRFGIYFPNITAEEAIHLAPNTKYKNKWIEQYAWKIKNHQKDIKEPQSPYLGTKDCALFPKKIKRKNSKGKEQEYYGVIIRLLPDMQIVYIKDFKELASYDFWKKTIKNLEDLVLLTRENPWEESHIGLSNPPIELNEGIIIPYHGARMNPERDYKFGAVLVDKNNPQKILGRTKKPILYATEPWEKNGVVSGKVVFPTGHAILDDKIHLFYGAGDKYIAHTIIDKQKLLDSFN